jgi:hypothetical protein
MKPGDPMPRYGVPINSDTGLPLTENQEHHLAAIKAAGDILYAAMHNADGSAQAGDMEDHHWSGSRMKLAADLLEMALMMARKAALG